MHFEPCGLSILCISVFGPRGCLHGSFTTLHRPSLLRITLRQIRKGGNYDLCANKSSDNAKTYQKPVSSVVACEILKLSTGQDR